MHRDGTILEEVNANLSKYVERDLLLAQTLHKLRSAGKRLFLLTNSRWQYTERMMVLAWRCHAGVPELPALL